MTAPASSEYSRITREMDVISFTVLGQRISKTFELTKWVIKGLLLTTEKTKLIFSEVVASRSIMEKTGDLMDALNFKQCDKSNISYSTDEFLKLLNYKPGISNAEWLKHLDSVKVIGAVPA